jgi:hypothetical protein
MQTAIAEQTAVEELHRQGLTDGLPVVAPTPERVSEFVAASGLAADELVAVVPPMAGDATVELVASNAVMAGCLPENMPVVLAGVRAMCREEFNLFGVRTSNHPASPLFIVGGPVAREQGFNWGTNVFGPGSRANATVGRALNLVIQNIGGAAPGLIDQSVMGHPGRYTYCIAEDPDTPWSPLHAAAGVDPEASAISCFAGDAPRAVMDYASTEPEDLLAAFSRGVADVWRDPFYAMSEVLLVANIAHAKVMTKKGWERGEILERVGTAARELCGALPLDEIGHQYEAGLHLVCAGGPWGQYSALVNGWVGPGPGSTMTTEEVNA